MIRMRTILAVAAALAGGVATAPAQQPVSPPARRPRAHAHQAAQAERMVVYKSPT